MEGLSLLKGSKSWQELLEDLRGIEVHDFKVYSDAAISACWSSYVAAQKWYEFWRLLLSPISTVLKFFAQIEFPYLKFLFSFIWDCIKQHVWPPVRTGLLHVWDWEKAAGPRVWGLQAGTLATLIFLWWIKLWLVRSGYIRKAYQRSHELVEGFKARWRRLSSVVEQKSKTAAFLLPHMIYWVLVSLACHFVPGGLVLLSEYHGREIVGLVLPVCLTTLQLCKPPSDYCHEKFSLLMMYWVLFAAAVVLHYIWSMLPSAVLNYTGQCGSNFLLLFGLWMQLPFGGVALLYSQVEPVIESYVKDITPPAFTSRFGGLLDMAVTLRLLAKDRKMMIVEVLTDSWLLVPCLLFLLTPSSFTYAATIYAGALVPAYNSIRALRNSTEMLMQPSKDSKDSADTFLQENLRKLKVRWLKYWCCYSIFWYFKVVSDSSLWFVPLLYHIYLVAIMALQLPLLRGAERIFDFLSQSTTAFMNEIMVKPPKKQHQRSKSIATFVSDFIVTPTKRLRSRSCVDPLNQDSSIDAHSNGSTEMLKEFKEGSSFGANHGLNQSTKKPSDSKKD